MPSHCWQWQLGNAIISHARSRTKTDVPDIPDALNALMIVSRKNAKNERKNQKNVQTVAVSTQLPMGIVREHQSLTLLMFLHTQVLQEVQIPLLASWQIYLPKFSIYNTRNSDKEAKLAGPALDKQYAPL